MSSDSQPLSVSEVLEMNVGDWINEGVIAVVRKIEPSQPGAKRKYWRCDLGDTVNRSADISLTMFYAPKFSAGDTIEITGQGIKRDEFNNYARISIGKSTEIHVKERAGSRSAAQPPANGAAPTDGGGAPPAAAEKTAPYMNGQTIGMAMKEAIALVRSTYPVIAATLLDDPVFWRRVYETSSDILRISHHIANGHLAPTAKERAKAATTGGGAAQKPPDKAPPKAPPSENLDEDVPF